MIRSVVITFSIEQKLTTEEDIKSRGRGARVLGEFDELLLKTVPVQDCQMKGN